ncbi:urea ABC transporter permease subunit UrtC [Pontiella agarivorans]|uniref:Urea ABC transporter permease subunit UrtC n=1 Tax=Pontiella agarivorans TaxID=3038953 RepID=A0ABU5MWL5_9BACT|nr:urea ABC transporter permease subunit UrtC [Pontiella agarivorans]MDZ8118552.1 urea ABC transporter permease subunit UrtC [Pontiella agarivorans]
MFKQSIKKLFPDRAHQLSFLILAVVLLVGIPLFCDSFRLNMAAKYLSLAFAAVGLVICWGYGGILSLGQAAFWGIGGYCMAAFLKLEAARNIAMEQGSDQIKALTTVGLPDFMDWNQITELPRLWYPFKSFPLTMICLLVVPGLIAYLLGNAIFKRRVNGVYFAIITQALCWLMEILFVTSQGLTGGINGITDLRTCLGWDIQSDSAHNILYFLTALLLLGSILLSKRVLHSKMGKILVAIRDMEDRVRFSGYDVSNFKVFAFAFAAVISAIGGALFSLNVGFMSPKLVTIEPSIYMVIFCALGGRRSLIGAVYGTLIVCLGRTFLSEKFPELWMFIMGGIFILTTVVCSDGLAGLVEQYGSRLWNFIKKYTRIDVLLAKISPRLTLSKEQS